MLIKNSTRKNSRKISPKIVSRNSSRRSIENPILVQPVNASKMVRKMTWIKEPNNLELITNHKFNSKFKIFSKGINKKS
jgi:hypothetical protein